MKTPEQLREEGLKEYKEGECLTSLNPHQRNQDNDRAVVIQLVENNPQATAELLAAKVMGWRPEYGDEGMPWRYSVPTEDGFGDWWLACRWNPASSLDDVALCEKELKKRNLHGQFVLQLALHENLVAMDRPQVSPSGKEVFRIVHADAPTRCAAIIIACGLEEKFKEMINQKQKG